MPLVKQIRQFKIINNINFAKNSIYLLRQKNSKLFPLRKKNIYNEKKTSAVKFFNLKWNLNSVWQDKVEVGDRLKQQCKTIYAEMLLTYIKIDLHAVSLISNDYQWRSRSRWLSEKEDNQFELKVVRVLAFSSSVGNVPPLSYIQYSI